MLDTPCITGPENDYLAFGARNFRRAGNIARGERFNKINTMGTTPAATKSNISRRARRRERRRWRQTGKYNNILRVAEGGASNSWEQSHGSVGTAGRERRSPLATLAIYLPLSIVFFFFQYEFNPKFALIMAWFDLVVSCRQNVFNRSPPRSSSPAITL